MIVLTERSSGVSIDNLIELDNNTLTFDAVLADQTVIHIISVYGPSADTPEYWEKVFDAYHACDNKLKLITGNLTSF